MSIVTRRKKTVIRSDAKVDIDESNEDIHFTIENSQVIPNIFKRTYDRVQNITSEFIYWSFDASFNRVFLSYLVIFFLIIIWYATIIGLIGIFQPHCFNPPFNASGSGLNDAFVLSWTTISTVGYGNISPAMGLGVQNSNAACSVLDVMCAIESFIGVIYAGLCCAIVFCKITRIQSHARVQFSDPILVRYGSGVHDNDMDITRMRSRADKILEDAQSIPCPVLEFRIVNTACKPGGEIMDTRLTCVATLDVFDFQKDLKSTSMRNVRESLQKFSKSVRKGITSDEPTPPSSKNSVNEPTFHRGNDEGIFSNLEIKSPDHPFFKRVWTVEHVLNERSPILTRSVRRRIQQNHGYWPVELNSYERVRENIKFKHIAVSLTGVGNSSASNVYAHKIYDYDDLNIGYQFASLLYTDEEGHLKVDRNLLNDVYEQDGGGREPFS